MDQIGIEKAKNYANKFGINFSEQDTGYSLALGGFSEGTTLEELTNAYTVFANNGDYKAQTFIKEIKNKYGVTIYKDTKIKEKIISEDTAYLMTSILQDGVKYGTSRKLSSLNCDIAGKTGTVASRDNRNSDAISIAYTPDYSVGCWLGNYTMDPENDLESNNNGGTYATAAIKDAFSYLNSIDKPSTFSVPETITKCRINNVVYENENRVVLANNSCEDRYTIEDYFSINNLPPKETSNTQYSCDISIVEIDDTHITMKVSTNKYFSYEIIRIHNNKETIIKAINNKTGETIFTDNNLKPETHYQYYIKYSQIDSSRPNISNILDITTLSNILPNTMYNEFDYEWLFS